MSNIYTYPYDGSGSPVIVTLPNPESNISRTITNGLQVSTTMDGTIYTVIKNFKIANMQETLKLNYADVKYQVFMNFRLLLVAAIRGSLPVRYIDHINRIWKCKILNQALGGTTNVKYYEKLDAFSFSIQLDAELQ